MKKLFTALVLLFCLSAIGSTVNIWMTNFVVGYPQTNYFRIVPVGTNVMANGAVIPRGLPILCYPNPSGFFSTNLQVGFYQITNQFVNLIFQSFNDSATYDLGDVLLSGANTYAQTGIRKISSADGSVGITPSSGVGNVDLSVIGGGGGGGMNPTNGTLYWNYPSFYYALKKGPVNGPGFLYQLNDGSYAAWAVYFDNQATHMVGDLYVNGTIHGNLDAATNLPLGALQPASALVGQVLKFTGSQWEPANEAGGTGGGTNGDFSTIGSGTNTVNNLVVGNGSIISAIGSGKVVATDGPFAKTNAANVFTVPQTMANTLTTSNQINIFGGTNMVGSMLQFHQGNSNVSAGLRWFDPNDGSHYYDLSPDIFSTKDFLAFHDSRIGQDVLKIGLGGSPYAGNFQIGVGDLDPSIQLRLYDVGKTNIQYSLLALSQQDGARFDSIANTSDALTIKRSFTTGGNWLHFLRGNSTTDWRIGFALDSTGYGNDLAFYNPGGSFPGASTNPGPQRFLVHAAGGVTMSGPSEAHGTLAMYDQINFFGATNLPYGNLIQLWRATSNQASGLRWYSQDDANTNHYAALATDNTGQWIGFYDSAVNQTVFKVGLGETTFPGRIEIGAGDLDPSTQLYISDVDSNINYSILALSRTNGIRLDSLAEFADAVTVKRGFSDGGNWVRWYRGDGSIDWRMGFGIDALGNGNDLVLYNPNGAGGSSARSPGNEVARFLTSGGLKTTTAYNTTNNAQYANLTNAFISQAITTNAHDIFLTADNANIAGVGAPFVAQSGGTGTNLVLQGTTLVGPTYFVSPSGVAFSTAVSNGIPSAGLDFTNGGWWSLTQPWLTNGPGGSTKFLREDYTWQVPPGSSGGAPWATVISLGTANGGSITTNSAGGTNNYAINFPAAGGQTNDAILIASTGINIVTNGPTGGKTSYTLSVAGGASATNTLVPFEVTNNAAASAYSLLTSSNLTTKVPNVAGSLTLYDTDMTTIIYSNSLGATWSKNGITSSTFTNSGLTSATTVGTDANGKLIAGSGATTTQLTAATNTLGTDLRSERVASTNVTSLGTILATTFDGINAALNATNTARLVANFGGSWPIRSLGITIDGGGSAITAGTKGYVEVPCAGTIKSGTILADASGSIAIEVWRTNAASFPPTRAGVLFTNYLGSAQSSTDSTLANATSLTLAAQDRIGFNVITNAASVTRATFQIRYQP